MKIIQKILKSFLFWIVLVLILVVVLVVFNRNTQINPINAKYQKQGYFICDTFDCIFKKLATCEKSFFRTDVSTRYIEEFVYEDNGKCIFKVIKSDKTGLECTFDKEVLSSLPKIYISNFKLIPEAKDACKLVQY
jgi:hypothetical protein